MPRRRILGPAALITFWSVFALIVATQTWLSMIAHRHSLLRMVAHQLSVWWLWVLFTPLLLRFTRHIPLVPLWSRNVLLHSGLALVLSGVHAFLWIVLTIWMRPYDVMTITRFRADLVPNFFARLPLELLIYFGVVAVAHALDFYTRAATLEKSLSTARLHALELQIQPHFLFNTFNAVSALVRAHQNADAVEVIAGLSDLLRYTLDHTGGQRVALEQEAAMLRRYLAIEQVRFADRLAVQIDVAADAKRAAVPTFILQALAENAIRHGITQSAAPGRIDVRVFRNDGALCIEVFNSGALRNQERPGLGICNTQERLRQLYGDAHRFAVRSVDGGVLAELWIPWSEIA